MKRFFFTVLVLVLLISVLPGCSGGKPAGTSVTAENIQNESTTVQRENTPVGDSGNKAGASGEGTLAADKFTTLKDYSDVVSTIEGQHEEIINEYDGMPVLELPVALLSIATAPIYEILNIEDADGRFEGVGNATGVPEFIEKKGTQISFGKDGKRAEDGFSPDSKKGDRVFESGRLDGDKGDFRSESFEERNGTKLIRSVTQCRLIDGNSVIILYQFGKASGGRETTNIFISAGKNHYEFVIGTSNAGTEFKEIALEFSAADQAIKAFEDNGLRIQKTGGIKNGKFEVIEK